MSEEGHGSVLVVDDEPQVAWVLRFSLEHEGYRTYTASNGIEALEELEKHHPGLMVLDLMMPEMDGFEFISHLRGNDAWQAIPVVVLTAKDITAEDHLRLQGNVRKVFLKASFSRDELAEEIRAAIETRSGSVESRAS